MTREAKIKYKKERAKARRIKNKERFAEHIRNVKSGYWEDADSPTGYSQYCDYQPGWGQSTCQYPCNGDC